MDSGGTTPNPHTCATALYPGDRFSSSFYISWGTDELFFTIPTIYGYHSFSSLSVLVTVSLLCCRILPGIIWCLCDSQVPFCLNFLLSLTRHIWKHAFFLLNWDYLSFYHWIMSYFYTEDENSLLLTILKYPFSFWIWIFHFLQVSLVGENLRILIDPIYLFSLLFVLLMICLKVSCWLRGIKRPSPSTGRICWDEAEVSRRQSTPGEANFHSSIK